MVKGKGDRMKYINPFSEKTQPEYYDRTGCKVTKTKCGRGQMVRVHPNHYDYLVDGRCVSQRSGANMLILEDIVAAVDGQPLRPGDHGLRRALETYRRQDND